MSGPTQSGVLALLIGNSHATCMVAAMRRKLFPAVTPEIAFRVVGYGSKAFPGGLVLEANDGTRVVNPVVTAAVDRAFAEARGRKVWLVSVIGGNAANRMAIFSSGPAADFLLPGEQPAETPAGVQWVPYDAIEATMARQLDSLSEFFARLPREKLAGVAHLEGPPPCMSNDFVYAALPEAARRIAVESGEVELTADSIAAPALRHRLWQCQARVTRQIAEARGVLYVEPPPQAVDVAGHRRLDTCSDACHGTPEYGRWALEHVARRLTDSTPGSPT
ncbi:MAG: hypothetical protein ACOZJX_07425 [Pseudomonadota bacterium]